MFLKSAPRRAPDHCVLRTLKSNISDTEPLTTPRIETFGTNLCPRIIPQHSIALCVHYFQFLFQEEFHLPEACWSRLPPRARQNFWRVIIDSQCIVLKLSFYHATMLFLILYRRKVVEGVTECKLDLGELPKGNYLPPVQY